MSQIPEPLRAKLPPEFHELGGSKAVLELDDDLVDACAQGREFSIQLLTKAKALAENIKLNGASFNEAWAALIVVNRNHEYMRGNSAGVLLAYLLTELAYGEDGL